ncbi:hypothetical protein [Actinoplanes subglobosus]|uniref:Uncharacterized protein n=1 Tax=Actinoplanes subglobosus TaxID=1547892 RepID=A0ABV8IVB4_9ACTN
MTFFNQNAAPAAASDQIPAGSTVKITNLDNNKSATIKITERFGGCLLLNNAAMDLVREPGKNIIRNNRVEIVSKPQAVGNSACQGSLTFFNQNAGPGAASDQIPVGSTVRVTNLANNKSATIKITERFGGCLLLNNAAMDLVREPGKNLVRENRVEVLSNGNGQGNANSNGNSNSNSQGVGNSAPAGGGNSACQGNVTFFNQNAAPAAASDQIPAGSTVKITNLDNNKSATIKITERFGGCLLLNNAAMDLVREPGKNVIRNNRVEIVSKPQAVGNSACQGSLTFFNQNAGPGAASDQIPVGSTVRVTNLANNKSATIKITERFGGCLLLNNAAMDLVREPGKNLVRENKVEIIR